MDPDVKSTHLFQLSSESHILFSQFGDEAGFLSLGLLEGLLPSDHLRLQVLGVGGQLHRLGLALRLHVGQLPAQLVFLLLQSLKSREKGHTLVRDGILNRQFFIWVTKTKEI
jgi:hypothetical protein